MVKNEYIVIWETPIYVNCIKREPGERFVEEETQELKNIVSMKYILKIKKIKEEEVK